MNIAECCFRKRTVTLGLSAALVLAGILSYFRLGRLEDPEFTIRSAQVVTAYPGATAQEVAERVTDPIETAVQRLGSVKHVTSTSYPGRSVVMVELADDCTAGELPQIWDELRRKVGDMASSLPEGCSAPLVNDDYGDVYGVFYAIYGDGYSYAELKRHAKLLRKELLLCEDVAKVDMIGDLPEIVEFAVPRAKIASLGVTPEQVAEALRGQNVPVDAGNLGVDDKFIRLHPTGTIRTVADFGNIELAENLYLRDVVEISKSYQSTPAVIVGRNGKPCIGLGISTVSGGNVITMGRAVERRMRELLAETPVGIEVDVISHQATSVETAVNGFVENLLESVVLVIAVLLFTMGMRSGLLIGGVLVMTVLATVFVMNLMGLMFERISLGAFIIALGMLVDNAIVIGEAVLVAAQKGESRRDAAIAVVRQTQWSLLGGTAIAILSFAPIGASQNSTGEYCRSLFLVIGISLLLSWVLALTVTPLLAAKYIVAAPPKAGAAAKDPYGGFFFRAYRRFLEWCIDNRGFTWLVLACLVAASVAGFNRVKQNFFPDSTRPQFMVHVWMPEGVRIQATEERVQAVAAYARKLKGVTGVSTFTGAGALRFLLTYGPEEPDAAYGLVMVDVESDGLIAGLVDEIERAAPELAPDALVTGQRFVLGPGDPQKIQMRLIGPDPKVLRGLAERALGILRADGRLKEVQSDWRNPGDLIEPVVSETRARKLGISRADIARALCLSTEGLRVGSYLEGDETLAVMMRAPECERTDPTGVTSAWAWSPRLGVSVPLAQVLDGVRRTSEEMRLKRRDRSYCITVKCNPQEGETAAAAFARVMPELEKLVRSMPAGYRGEWGGEYENSKDANEELAPTFAPILAAMVLTVLMLFNSVKKTAVIFLTLPLIIVGVVAGLLAFDQPFGFMALLGLLSLVGMQVKNAIVLMDEISANLDRGLAPYVAIVEAGVSRVRPVANASLTTVLGMLPLLADAFYSAMAVTIMFGLAFATVLTMVVIPVNYALLYRVRRP